MKPKDKKRRKQLDPATVLLIKQILFGVFIFSIFALIVTTIWYGTRLSFFTIDEVSIEGGYTIDQNKVRAKIEEQLSGNYIKLIPKRFSYFYPEENIYNAVNQVERIKDVKVEKVSRKKVSVTYDEYIPDSLWCNKDRQDECFFLDQNGYAFGRAPNLSGSSLIRYFALESEFTLGKKPFKYEYYKNSREFISLVSQLGWFVKSVEISSVGDVFYVFVGDSEVKANLDMSALDTVTNLQTILNSDEFSHLKPGNFLYLDLRFGSRVFVNENINTEEEIISTTTEEVIIEDELED